MTKTCVLCKKQPIPGDVSQSFHRFPNEKSMSDKWVDVVKIKSVTINSTVCSDHFLFIDYHQTEGYTIRRRLLANAVPQINFHKNILHETVDLGHTSQNVDKENCNSESNEPTVSETVGLGHTPETVDKENSSLKSNEPTVSVKLCGEQCDTNTDSTFDKDKQKSQDSTAVDVMPGELKDIKKNDNKPKNLKRKCRRGRGTTNKKSLFQGWFSNTYHIKRSFRV